MARAIASIALAICCGCTAVIEDRLSDKPTEQQTVPSTTQGSGGAGGGPGAGGFGGAAAAGGAGGQPLCEPSDEFDDGVVGPQWDLLADDGVSVAETGVLNIDIAPGGANRWGRVLRAAAHDATACGMTVLFQGSPGASQIGYAELYVDADNRAGFHLVGGQLRFRQLVAGVEDETTAIYDPVGDRWWRVVREQGEFVWSTSPDGIDWTERARKSSALDPSAMHVLLGAGLLGTDGGPLSVQYDHLNWPP